MNAFFMVRPNREVIRDVHRQFLPDFTSFPPFRNRDLCVPAPAVLPRQLRPPPMCASTRLDTRRPTRPFRLISCPLPRNRGRLSALSIPKGTRFIRARIGALLGTWSNSTKLAYDVYALSFAVPGGELYTISVKVPAPATSPPFAVNAPHALYPGLLLNTLWFYETERDGPDYIPNALRTAPGHLNDKSATVYDTPPLNNNDLITTTGTPLTSTGAVIDGAGGWWDAGDYMKYVETMSYTTGAHGNRNSRFSQPDGTGRSAKSCGASGFGLLRGNRSGAPASSDFSAEAQFGFDWLMRDVGRQQQDSLLPGRQQPGLETFPILKPNTTSGRCRRLPTITEVAPRDYFYICYRPGFIAAPAGSPISPNLAGRLAAAFAEYYQLYRTTDPTTAPGAAKRRRHLRARQHLLADPAKSVDGGTCPPAACSPSRPSMAIPRRFGMTTWSWAQPSFTSRCTAQGNLPAGLPVTNPIPISPTPPNMRRTTSPRFMTPATKTRSIFTMSADWRISSSTAPWAWRAIPTGWRSINPPCSLRRRISSAWRSRNPQPMSGASAFPGNGDTTSHGAGLSVMASELYYLTHEQLQHLRSEMAGQRARRELLGIVVHCRRWDHVSQLHPAPGGESRGSARWNLGWNADPVGSCSEGPPVERLPALCPE